MHKRVISDKERSEARQYLRRLDEHIAHIEAKDLSQYNAEGVEKLRRYAQALAITRRQLLARLSGNGS